MKLFKNKVSDNDFTELDLPINRKEQFRSIIKTDFSTLIKIGLILLVALLPKLVLDISRVIVVEGIYSTTPEGEQIEMIKQVNLIYYLALILCFLILSVAISGIFRILKRLVWGKPIFLKDDFSKGIKENFKQFLPIFGIESVISFACEIIVGALISNPIMQGVVIGINIIIFIPINLLVCFISTFYSNSLFKNISNSVLMFKKCFVVLLPLCCCFYCFYFLNFIPFIIISSLLKVLLIIVLVPIIFLSIFEYLISCFDELINKEKYKSIYRNGLRKID